jgi:hypothetical protein
MFVRRHNSEVRNINMVSQYFKLTTHYLCLFAFIYCLSFLPQITRSNTDFNLQFSLSPILSTTSLLLSFHSGLPTSDFRRSKTIPFQISV